MIEGATREETIRLTALDLGISELLAGFIVAQELGEIEGDVVAVDDDGESPENKPPSNVIPLHPDSPEAPSNRGPIGFIP